MHAPTPASTRLPALAAVVAALGLVACGGGSSGDEDEVKKTVNGIYDALGAKDADKVCASLSERGKREVTSGSPRRGKKRMTCEQVFSFGLSFAGDALKDAGDAKVTKVEVDGSKATATVNFRKQSGKVGLVKEDGKWKVSDLDVR